RQRQLGDVGAKRAGPARRAGMATRKFRRERWGRIAISASPMATISAFVAARGDVPSTVRPKGGSHRAQHYVAVVLRPLLRPFRWNPILAPSMSTMSYFVSTHDVAPPVAGPQRGNYRTQT